MGSIWKVIITIFVLYIITTDANRARRRRQTPGNAGQPPANLNAQGNVFNPQTDARQQHLLPNPQMLNAQGPQQMNPGGLGTPKDADLRQAQTGRQFYQNPNQYGYGQQGSSYYPYTGVGAGAGVGAGGQYGAGLNPSFGQGMGSYYNQNPGSSSFYGGVNTGGYYNRPGHQSNYYPSGSGYGGGSYGGGSYGGGSYGAGSYGGGGGGNYNSGYYWNAGQKQSINIFTIFLSSLLALVVCFITI